MIELLFHVEPMDAVVDPVAMATYGAVVALASPSVNAPVRAPTCNVDKKSADERNTVNWRNSILFAVAMTKDGGVSTRRPSGFITGPFFLPTCHLLSQ